MKSFYMNLKIKHKLVIILCIIGLITNLLGISVLQLSFNIYRKHIYRDAAEILYLYSKNVETKIESVNKLSYNILTDKDIQEYLLDIKNNNSNYKSFLSSKKIEEKLLSWALSENYISSIHIIDVNGNEYVNGSNIIQVKDSQKKEIVSTAQKKEGAIVWREPTEQDETVMLTRMIRGINELSLEMLGTIIIRIDPAKIVDTYTSNSAKYDSNIAIFSNKGIIFEENKQLDLNNCMLLMKKEHDYFTLSLNHKKYLVVYKKNNNTDWTFVNFLLYESIFEEIENMKILMINIHLCIFILAIFFGIKFAKGITKPIEKLTNEMKIIETGNFEAVELEEFPADRRKDEIGYLEQDFRIMIRKINTLINENYKKQIVINEAQFKALQAQINPHFLYNTLDTVHWLAKVNKQQEIATMVKSLASLLRSTISFREPIITLENEIQIVENYITIQKIRYEDRLDFSININKELYTYMIPKLILQPLVENSIKYGLEKLIGVCKIQIEANLKDDYLELKVSDNGPGMDKDVHAKLEKFEFRSRGSGIGLKNINDRIKTMFGAQYGLLIDSEKNKGTTVVIQIPNQF